MRPHVHAIIAFIQLEYLITRASPNHAALLRAPGGLYSVFPYVILAEIQSWVDATFQHHMEDTIENFRCWI